MLNKYFLKQILVALFLVTSFNTYAFFTLIKPPSQTEIIQRNLENDLAFRLNMGKTMLVNLNNFKNNCHDKKILHAAGNLSLATLAGISILTYPINGHWDVIYNKSYHMDPDKILALKLITLISSANACVNPATEPRWDNKWWYIETGISAFNCGRPAFKIAWSFRS